MLTLDGILGWERRGGWAWVPETALLCATGWTRGPGGCLDGHKQLYVTSLQEIERHVFCMFGLEKNVRRRKTTENSWSEHVNLNHKWLLNHLSSPQQKPVAFLTDYNYLLHYDKHILREITGFLFLFLEIETAVWEQNVFMFKGEKSLAGVESSH